MGANTRSNPRSIESGPKPTRSSTTEWIYSLYSRERSLASDSCRGGAMPTSERRI
jgi:hypothetical protein